MSAKIALLTTGGTIASQPDDQSGLLVSGRMTGEQLLACCQLPDAYEIEVHDLFQKPSMHLSLQDWVTLKQKVDAIFGDPRISGIVITHGTDTLEETAYVLDLICSDPRPVVVTGSQRPIQEAGSDGLVNLSHAIVVAADPQMQHQGTVVVFNERIFPARYVRKVHASNVQGFDAGGYGCLGVVDRDKVHVFQRVRKREHYVLRQPLPAVDIVISYVGADGKIIDAALQQGVAGIILQGAGRGQVPPSMLPSIKKAVQKGVPCVLTTSAEEGFVHPVYDYPGSAFELHHAGVILGGDYDSKKARIKLSVLLAARVRDLHAPFGY